MMSEHSIGKYVVELSYLWVKMFMWDVNIRPNGMSRIITDSYYALQSIQFDTLKELSRELFNETTMRESYVTIGRVYFAIVAPVYVYILAKLYFGLKRVDMHRTVFSLDSFALRMSRCVPQLLPVVYVNPQHQLDLDQGTWRMSPKIFDYMKSNDCLRFDENDRFSLKERETTQLLIKQLGDRWTGFDNLPINHFRIAAISLPMVVSPATGKPKTDALIEMFCVGFSSKPHFDTELKRFIKMAVSPRTYLKKGWFGKLSACYSEVLDSRGEKKRQESHLRKADKIARQYVKEYKDHPKVVQILSKHAYQVTSVCGLIEGAWLGGAMPSCNCLWLKPMDRNLFYAFNNLGRDVSWIEVTGFWSHYLTEQKVGFPFPYPKVQAGVAGIDDYFENSFYTYDPIVDSD